MEYISHTPEEQVVVKVEIIETTISSWFLMKLEIAKTKNSSFWNL